MKTSGGLNKKDKETPYKTKTLKQIRIINYKVNMILPKAVKTAFPKL